jgi:nucleoside-diphosphate-sugar epimerase
VNLLVTGANGFVGRGTLARFSRDNDVRVRAAVRHEHEAPSLDANELAVVGDIHGTTDWRRALADVDVVVHLAARAHLPHENSSASMDEFRTVNTDGAVNLARQAATSGVRRLIFLSSVKVNGDEGRFSETDAPKPKGGYALSKHDAENGIRRVAEQRGLQLVIVRPPLVYGPGVRANFRHLIKAVESGVPLPLAGIRNRRSFVALENLADFLLCCAKHPAAAGEIFFVSDDEDVSTPDLMRRLARVVGRSARLWPMRPALLSLAAGIVGRREAVERLTTTLTVDVSKAKRVLGWTPVVSLDAGLALAVRAH